MAARRLAFLSRQFATTSIIKKTRYIFFNNGPLSALQRDLMYFFFLSEGSGRRRPPVERNALSLIPGNMLLVPEGY